MVALIACQACRKGENRATGIIVVNATAAGEISRVLAREGMEVTEGQPIAEIAVAAQAPAAAPTRADEQQARSPGNVELIQTQIEAARKEVVRLDVEVQRLSSLVSAGQASPADLDAARALRERAQQHLQSLKTAAQQAQGRRVAEQQRPGNSSIATPPPAEQITIVRASAAGTVSALSARIGQRVAIGQPLATIRAH